MDSVKAIAFFSRAFDDRTKASVNTIQAICRGLDVQTVCVERADPNVPSAEANDLIKKADFLIALCSRVHKIDGKDEYLTSTAVREEIAIATALKKKIVFFFESKVKADGFAYNIATGKTLENASDLTIGDIESVIAGVHSGKLKSIIKGEDVFHATGIKNFNISRLRAQLELRNTTSGLIWEYVIEKTLNFEAEHDLPITSAAYCMQDMADCECAPLYQYESKRNGSPASPKLDVRQHRGFIEIKSRFEPLPQAGEAIFIREKYQSPYLAPVYLDPSAPKTTIMGKRFDAFDGMAIVHRINHLQLRFILPDNFGVTNVTPVVATFSNSLDYINESEIERINNDKLLSTESFDGSMVITLSVDRPMWQYFYGIAWNQPVKDEMSPALARESDVWVM